MILLRKKPGQGQQEPRAIPSSGSSDMFVLFLGASWGFQDAHETGSPLCCTSAVEHPAPQSDHPLPRLNEWSSTVFPNMKAALRRPFGRVNDYCCIPYQVYGHVNGPSIAFFRGAWGIKSY